MEIKPNKRKQAFIKVSQEKIDKILKDIKRGAPKKYASESNGITERQFYYLLEQGRCDLNNEIYHSLHARLVQSLRTIEKEEIIECRDVIKKTPDGAKWVLEQVYWRDFGGNAAAIEMDERITRLEQGDGENDKTEQMDTESD